MWIPERNFVGIWFAEKIKSALSEREIVSRAFKSPIGMGKLSVLCCGKRNVLIITDDYTRNTNLKFILPFVLKELRIAGVAKNNIRIMVALGTHRKMTKAEMEEKFGKRVSNEYEILNHSSDKSDLVYLGRTRSGIPVWVNKIVTESDFVIGVGHIATHGVVGFSGGGKIIQPGVCGEETTQETHWKSLKYSLEEINGNRDNPLRRDIDEVAKIAGLKFIVNSIQDAKGSIVGMVTGDPVKAHRKGCEIVKKFFGVKAEKKPDIIITDSNPYNTDLWQSAKAIYNAGVILKRDGVIILVSDCPEGIAKTHKIVEEKGYINYTQGMRLYKSGKVKDLIGLGHITRVGRIVREKGKLIIVSSCLSKRQVEKMGAIYADSPKDALEKAFIIKGGNAMVGVVKNGGEIFFIQ